MPEIQNTTVRANRLAKEQSPYLLQHQYNPVDWFPWGEEAFAKSRMENKPIFLSIGYSTCHWCHVMERESFENEAVAECLNRHFVCIKVDREERPDVDKAYLATVQALTGQGGWPLSVFLDTHLRPFYGGTYFPAESRHGLPGFLTLVKQIQHVWESRNAEVTHTSGDLVRKLGHIARQTSKSTPALTAALLHNAAEACKGELDPDYGGFGRAPKFPRPAQPDFLLRYGIRFLDQDAVDNVAFMCNCMANGGIFDQLGGGFSRYSVDEKWHIPHFEKMLYDNAQLLSLYCDVFRETHEPRMAQVAREIAEYALRDLAHPEGGFFSAEDADSEGKEGKFYCWTESELVSLLNEEEFQLAKRCFGLSPEGNFIDHSDPNPLLHQNVLWLTQAEFASQEAIVFAAVKRKMLEARNKRIRPRLDDKVLTSWNGLMMGALAKAAVIFQESKYLEAAQKNLVFIQKHLWNTDEKSLSHRWCKGVSAPVQILDDYAFLLSGVIELYEVTLMPDYLSFAISLAEAMLERFFDKEHGGFWQTPTQSPQLILQFKEDYDGAEPSGNSVAVHDLLRLSAITGKSDFRQAAEKTLNFFAYRMESLPLALPHMLSGLDCWLAEPLTVVIGGPTTDAITQQLISVAHRECHPSKIVMGCDGPVAPFYQKLGPMHGKPTAYVCTGNACQLPVSDPHKLQEALEL
jgi:uncharacterized protein YyaL (SSP411 family)